MVGLGLDRKALLELLDHDEQLLDSVIRTFLADCPRMLTAIRAAVAAQDPNQIMTASHSLKGAVSVFGATRAVEASHNLESLGRQATPPGVGDALANLEQEIALVVTALDKILQGNA